MAINRRKFIQIGSAASFQVFLISVAAKAGLGVPFINQITSDTTGAKMLRDFLRPADEYKSSCYWWWFNGLVNKAGITRDLEAYREKGMGAVLLVNSAGGLGGVPFPQGAKFLSEQWKELYRHAMKEAKRLRIDVGINLCSGWCMGGPWIEPKNAGRWYLQSTLSLQGPKKFSGKLPLPDHRAGYDHVFNPPGYKEYIDLPLEELDYQDTAVVAIFHPKPGEGEKITGSRTKVLDAKTNHRDASNFSRADEIMGPVTEIWKNEPGDLPAPVDKVIDLTSKVQKDGQLDWEVPPGDWTIIRTGHRMTGSRLMIAQPEADGLSIDWFDHKGVELQFEHLGKIFIEEAAKVGNKPQYFCDDSFEDGFPNWTADIVTQFKKYRGYDPTPYMPALSGYIIESADVSDRFLHDYRKTLGDLMANEHYGKFAELCHQNGIKVQNESAGPSRSATMCMDGLKNLGRSDFPMGEFWLGPHHEDPSTLTDDKAYGLSRLDLGQNKVTKMTASAAHLYGRETASAEAFTSFRHWLDCPGTLKQALDRAYCEGINRIAIHTSTATRPEDGKPGYEYGAGTHFNPNVTWWEKSEAFFAYIARCQQLLRSGKFVADVLFYNGDGAPNLVAQKHIDPSMGAGYDYDVCNEEILLERIQVQNGRIVLPDGMHYEVLVLPEMNIRMPMAVLQKLADLVAAGAWIIGARPLTDAGLKDYPACDQKITELAAKLWGPEDSQGKYHAFGKGKVAAAIPIREALREKGIVPDFTYHSISHPEIVSKDILWIDFIHRHLPEAEIYFLTNRLKQTAAATCRFRRQDNHLVPRLWDAVSGKVIQDLSYKRDGVFIELDLCFDVFQSVFVIFSQKEVPLIDLPREARPASEDTARLWQTRAPLATRQTLAGSWNVSFDPKWGGPGDVSFAALQDWSKHSDPRIRYYSGKAIYRKEFDVQKTVSKPDTVFLDLGTVKDIASVTLNGTSLGIVWTAPWRLDISGLLMDKGNKLEIEIINQWPNRLIGDAALPMEKRLTHTNIVFKKDDPLLVSGLLGPVTLQGMSALSTKKRQ